MVPVSMPDAAPDDGGDDLLEAHLSLPEQLETTRREAADLAFSEGLEHVLFAGMGGSAIAASYAAAWADAEGSLPVDVVRSYDPPAWVGGDTLVAAVSYSGNTEETLSVFTRSRGRAGGRVAVTSGGRLAERAGPDEPVLSVPSGHEPRAAMGYLFARTVEVVEALGGLDPSEALADAVKTLRGLRPELEPAAREGNPARVLAAEVEGRLPVVYGAGLQEPVARRLAGQLNENAKHLSLHGGVPEMNHNDVVGWGGLEDPGRLVAVLLRDPEEHRQMDARFGFLEDVLEDRGVPTVTVEARGSSVPGRLLSSTMVADAASVYLARRKGVDPGPVEAIDALKERLAGTGFREDLLD